MGRPAEHGFMVLGRQVRAQQPHRGQAQDARGKEVEDHGEFLARPHRLDAVASRVLGEVKRLTQLERGQVAQELGRGLALPDREGIEASEEVLIGKGNRGDEDVCFHGTCFTVKSGSRLHRHSRRSVLRHSMHNKKSEVQNSRGQEMNLGDEALWF